MTTLQTLQDYLGRVKVAQMPTMCLELAQEGCSLLGSAGEALAIAERSYRMRIAELVADESVAKAEALAKSTEEYQEYRTYHAYFEAIDQSITTLRKRADIESREFQSIKSEL